MGGWGGGEGGEVRGRGWSGVTSAADLMRRLRSLQVRLACLLLLLLKVLVKVVLAEIRGAPKDASTASGS